MSGKRSCSFSGLTARNFRFHAGVSSLGAVLARVLPMTVWEYPTKSAETRSLAPTVLSTTTLDRPHALHKPTDHREQQVQAKQPNNQLLHDSTSINCSRVGEPARPSGVW
jgi:hypothetical protein